MRCEDQCVEAPRQCAVEPIGIEPLVVDRDRNRPEVQRLQQVEQSRERRILDPDPVAGPEVRLQDAFDSVECAADEAQRGRVDAGAAELGPGVRDERIQLGVLLVAGDVGTPRGDALECPADRGDEHGVDDAGREVADARGQLLDPRRTRLQPHRDARSAAAVADHEAALAQQAVGGGRGPWVHPALDGQGTHRGQPLAGAQGPGLDALLELERDGLCPSLSCHIVCGHYHGL